MNTIGDLVHHVDERRSCSRCGARVYTFADVRDEQRVIVGHLCRTCKHVLEEG